MKNLLFLFITLFLVSCVPSYQAPNILEYNKSTGTINIHKGFNEVWTSLIEYSTSSFFAIDNFEKDSGLMTLEFGSSNPSEFIDCGWLKATSANYQGPFVEGAEQFSLETTLNGRMNLFIKEITPNLTQVKVRARYIFNVIDTPNRRQTWSFDTGGSDSKKIGAIRENVVCQPTHKAESEIIKGIEKISKGVPFN